MWTRAILAAAERDALGARWSFHDLADPFADPARVGRQVADVWAFDPTLERVLLVDELPDPLRLVTILRYGFDGGSERSCRQVARMIGVSDFTVRARLDKAHRSLLRRLR